MTLALPVYVFRDERFAAGEDTWVTVASLDRVVAVFGGSGLKGEAGLEAVFGGSALFKDDNGASFLGVWGERNGSNFRNRLRQSETTLAIVHEPPPARLVWWSTIPRRNRPA